MKIYKYIISYYKKIDVLSLFYTDREIFYIDLFCEYVKYLKYM